MRCRPRWVARCSVHVSLRENLEPSPTFIFPGSVLSTHYSARMLGRVKPSKNLTLAGFVASLQNLTEVVSHLSFHVLLLAL